MTDFTLHPQLLSDCHILGRLNVSHVLLHANTRVPWIILVPEVETTHYHLIERERRIAIEDEVNLISRFVMDFFGATRINSAAIGNIVSQVHLHIIGRTEADPCWPGVVWGLLPNGHPYDDSTLQTITTALTEQCGLRVS